MDNQIDLEYIKKFAPYLAKSFEKWIDDNLEFLLSEYSKTIEGFSYARMDEKDLSDNVSEDFLKEIKKQCLDSLVFQLEKENIHKKYFNKLN